MQSLRAGTILVSDAIASRLASHAAASCSSQYPQSAGQLLHTVAGCLQPYRCFAGGVDYTQAPPGGDAGKTKLKSDDQPGDSLEAELTRVRAKRLLRTDKPNYFENEDFEEELKHQSILVDPDVPIYDLPEVMDQIGMPLKPSSPLFDKIKDLPLDHPDVQALLAAEAQEEPPPFPGARQILQWEQRLVLSVGDTTGQHPKNKKAKCSLYLRDLQEQTGLTDDALQLIARVCGKRYNPRTGKLVLISEKYEMREENRRHIMETITQLVSEGHQAFPAEDANLPPERLEDNIASAQAA